MQKQQLFASERLDGVLFRREPRGDKPGDEGEQNAHRDQNERGRERKLGDARYADRRAHHAVDDETEDIGYHDADHAGDKADDESLGVEQARDVLFSAAQRTDDAYLLHPLYHGYISYYRDHDRGDHERKRGERHQGIGDDVYHVAYHGDDDREIVRIGYLRALFRRENYSVHGDVALFVPGVQISRHAVFKLEIHGVNANCLGH